MRKLRQAARDGLYDPDAFGEYYQGLTLYLLGALKFKNLDDRPGAKQIAFWSAATLRHLLQATSPCAKYADRESNSWTAPV